MHTLRRTLLVLATTLYGGAALTMAGCGKPSEGTRATSAAPTTVGIEIDDTVVTTRVKSALFSDPDIKSFDLKVETRKGAVQLSGFVDSKAQADRAAMSAKGVPGVVSVDNAISIRNGPSTVGSTVDDGIVTTRVRSALLMDAQVKSSEIAVATSKGEVQLSGYVDSQAQIDQAVAVAGKVEGVTRVGNEMRIRN